MHLSALKVFILTLLFALSFCWGWIFSQHLHFYKIIVLEMPDEEYYENRKYTEHLSNIEKTPAMHKQVEIDCLAKNIYFEAGNQSIVGKEAVGIVVLNRVEHPNSPDSICDVIFQKSQFSWYWDGKSDNPEVHDPQWEVSKNVAKQLIMRYNQDMLFDDEFDATHYHADYVNPHWAKSLQQIAKIDNHIFYR